MLYDDNNKAHDKIDYNLDINPKYYNNHNIFLQY